MSTRIMAVIWPIQMPPTVKAVVISLSDMANDEGHCWPSIRRLAERTCLSERAIQGAIAWAEQHRLLKRSMRDGRSTVYVVTPEDFTPPQYVHPRSSCTPAGAAPTPAGDAPPPPQYVHPRSSCTPAGAAPTPAGDAPPPPQHVHPTPAAGAPRTVKEPSVESSGSVARAREHAQAVAQAKAVQLAVEFRTQGVDTQASDPRLLTLAEQGVSPATVRAACEHARKVRPNARLRLGYVLGVLSGWAEDAEALRVEGARAPGVIDEGEWERMKQQLAAEARQEEVA